MKVEELPKARPADKKGLLIRRNTRPFSTIALSLTCTHGF